MILKKLGGNAYRLTQDFGPQTEKHKTPANTRSVVFLHQGKEIIVVRGSLMLMKREIMQEIIGQ